MSGQFKKNKEFRLTLQTVNNWEVKMEKVMKQLSLIEQKGKSPGGGECSPLMGLLENPVDRRVWRATVDGVAKS